MKDRELELLFDGYFKGLKAPENMTDDAKSRVSKSNKKVAATVKIISAAASFLLVFICASVFLFKPLFEADSGTPQIEKDYYYSSSLTVENVDAYEVSKLSSALAPIEVLAIAPASTVEYCKAGYIGNDLALIEAGISLIDGVYRHETTIYVEFTESGLVYSELADYYKGERGNYNGAEYLITKTTLENGEPQFKLYVEYSGVKYYIDLRTSDENGYYKYLNVITAG